MTSSCDPLAFPDPNISSYVLEFMGSRCQPMFIVLPTLIIYPILLLLGVIGNACTCLVIIADKSMHNPTNFYLFSLAISDIIILILGLPMELHSVVGYSYPYDFPSVFCRLRAFITEFTSYASITVICAFSVERYFAICFPLRAKMFATLPRAVIVIIISWTVSFIAALPMAGIVDVHRLEIPEGTSDEVRKLISSRDDNTIDNTEYCGMDISKQFEQKILIYTSFAVFFTLPAIVMSIMYGHIAYRLRSADRMLSDKKESRISRSRRTVIKVLVSVVVTFFTFWLPYHIQRLLSVFLNDDPEAFKNSRTLETLAGILFYLSGTCYYSNSVCNPILYNILSENYRRAFCRVILGERLARKLFPNISQDMRGYSVTNSHIRRVSVSMNQSHHSISAPCKHSITTLKQYPNDIITKEISKKCDIPSINVTSESDYLLMNGTSLDSGQSI